MFEATEWDSDSKLDTLHSGLFGEISFKGLKPKHSKSPEGKTFKKAKAVTLYDEFKDGSSSHSEQKCKKKNRKSVEIVVTDTTTDGKKVKKRDKMNFKQSCEKLEGDFEGSHFDFAPHQKPKKRQKTFDMVYKDNKKAKNDDHITKNMSLIESPDAKMRHKERKMLKKKKLKSVEESGKVLYKLTKTIKQTQTALNNEADEEKVKGKKKRKRKKKNNSKKNKYKHLALANKQESRKSASDEDSEKSHPVKDVDSQSITLQLKKQEIPKVAGKEEKLKSGTLPRKENLKKVKRKKTDAGLEESEETKAKKQKISLMENTPVKKQGSKSPFNIAKLKQIFHEDQDPLDDKKAESKDTESVMQVVSQDARDMKKKRDKSIPLRQRMQQQLQAARFRYLNEKLYTCTGEEAFDMFEQDQEAFRVYHQGFQGQVGRWPDNPVDLIIRTIKERPSSLVVADFGCGDAKIAQSVKNEVHSFDLVALNSHVTACDIAKVPLKNKSVDIGVFCLSLMGTNLTDYLCEANRVLKKGGTLLVAEVVSRFEKLGSFVLKLEKLGFLLKSKDTSNKMFVMLEFVKKEGPIKDKIPEVSLLPCIYKKR